MATDLKDTTFVMKNYKPEKDWMFRIRAFNDYGMSDPTMAATIFAKPRKYRGVKVGEAFTFHRKNILCFTQTPLLNLSIGYIILESKIYIFDFIIIE